MLAQLMTLTPRFNQIAQPWYGDATATYRSCGATLNGEFMVIGGGSDKKQVKMATMTSNKAFLDK